MEALAALGSLTIPPNTASSPSVSSPARVSVSTDRRDITVSSAVDKQAIAQDAEAKAKEKEPAKQDIKDATEILNGVMSDLHTNIKFSVDDKTKVLQVQIVDARDQRVIKEIPPKEFLDMMAKLRDLAGAIFDRHA
jgi:flagellar protein FlaG